MAVLGELQSLVVIIREHWIIIYYYVPLPRAYLSAAEAAV